MQTVKSALLRGILYLTAMLPLSWARALGRGVARLYWHIGGRSRRVTERNIELAFPALPAAEREALARRSLIATGELIMEMGHIWLRPWPYVRGLVHTVEGDELIRDALDAGRGVIVLGPHLGNWEMGGLMVGAMAPSAILYEPPRMQALDRMIRDARERSGATLVPTDARGIASLVRSVRGGNISCILPDQTPTELSSGENSDFFGVSCFTGTLAIKLLRRTGALAVFGFAQRTPRGFVLKFLPAEDTIYSEDNQVALAALNRGVETCVSHCVEQYQWEYKRFRPRPRVGPGNYAGL
jgi:KDO2-lipid IV(A) lauroyltransferase